MKLPDPRLLDQESVRRAPAKLMPSFIDDLEGMIPVKGKVRTFPDHHHDELRCAKRPMRIPEIAQALIAPTRR